MWRKSHYYFIKCNRITLSAVLLHAMVHWCISNRLVNVALHWKSPIVVHLDFLLFFLLRTITAMSSKDLPLQGSARIVTEFFQYSLNAILYQRGVYPAEGLSWKPLKPISYLISINISIPANQEIQSAVIDNNWRSHQTISGHNTHTTKQYNELLGQMPTITYSFKKQIGLIQETSRSLYW